MTLLLLSLTPVVVGQTLLASLIVCLIALLGGLSYFLTDRALRRFTQFGLSLSVGVLLGDTFLHLLPEALEQLGSIEVVMNGTLGGMLLFFLLEKGVRSRHHHAHHKLGESVVKSFTTMNLVGDGVHNFIDGTLIASAFLVSPEAGWATTLGIVIHELPQEIGDIGALVAGGYPIRRAVVANLFCAMTCLLGVGVIFTAGVWLEAYTVYALPVAAGGFIYIAASDLIPELHRQTARSAALWQSLFIAIGVGCMVSILLFE